MARVLRRLAQLLDVDLDSTPPEDGDALVYDEGTETWVPGAGGGGGGSDDQTAAEVPFSPAGTIAATNTQAAVEEVATEADSALTTHAADTTSVHGIADTSALALTANVQPVDADLTAIAALSPSNDDVIQRKGGAWSNRTIAQLLSDLAAAGTTFQPKDTTLDTYAGIDPAANVQSILGAADYAAIRTLLGLVIGTNVQAFDADLSTYAGISPSANVQSLLGAANYAAIRALLDLEANTDFYAPGGTDVALADGGTGASLADPGADRILFWDDSAGTVKWLIVGTGLAITDETVDASYATGELDYAQITSPVTVNATSEASPNDVVAVGARSYDGSTTILVEFFAPSVTVGANANGFVYCNLWDGSTDLGRICYAQNNVATAVELPYYGARRLTPSNGSHTFSIKAWRAAVDGSISAGAGGVGTLLPAFIRVSKV